MALNPITADTLRTLNTVVVDKFAMGMANAKESPVVNLVMHTEGIGETISFPFLAHFPIPKELVGDPVFEQVIDSIYQIPNREYHAGVEIKSIQLQRRNTALYAPLVEKAGRNAQIAPSLLALELLTQSAFDPKCKDFTGTAFIADNKPYFEKPAGYKGKLPDGKWSNKGTGKLSTKTLSIAMANIQSRRGMDGTPLGLGLGNFVLAVAPENGVYANMVVRQRAHFASNDQPLFGQVSVLPVAGITGDQWFLFDMDDVIKPIIINHELPFTIQTTANDPNCADIIKHRKIVYSIYGTYGIGWGSSFHAYGSTGTDGEMDKFPNQP